MPRPARPAAPSGCLPALVTWPVRRRPAGGRLAGAARGRPGPAAEAFGRGIALRGRLWSGATAAESNPGRRTVRLGESTGTGPVFEDGIVIVDATGRIAVVGPAEDVSVPSDLPVVEAVWIGPGIVDANVHLAGTGRAPARLLEDELRAGVVAVRDLGSLAELGSSADLGTGRRAGGPLARPAVAASGRCLVVDGGGREVGTASFRINHPADARRAVAQLAMDGADLIRVVVGARPGDPAASCDSTTLAAVVIAAHAAGLPVTATAMSVAAVRTALAAGVDELAQVPVEPLPDAVVEAVAAAGI
ncbi:MAG: hypothetical protein ACQSGP_18980, partial [Frankia sp.]